MLEESDLKNLFDLGGKKAIVTGASGGLGTMISHALATFGADLVLVGRNEERLRTSRALVEKEGIRAITIETDLTKKNDVESMISHAIEEFGKIDIFVNAHGINIRRPTDSMTLEDWEKVVDSDLKSVFLCCQAVGREMIKRRSGKIVSVSSTSASLGYDKGYSAYAPSKAGVESLTRTLAAEWGKYNINVNAIAPFFIKTAITADVLNNKEFYEWVLSGIPMKRIGTPTDIAGAVVFLCSKAADWITGQVISIDGGRSIT
jgi:NAD(P)-dependent dehydrogenase (short-subunit alcohol dehydrogenase family)